MSGIWKNRWQAYRPLIPVESVDSVMPELFNHTVYISLTLHVVLMRLGKLSVVDLTEVNPDLGSSEDQKKTLDAAKKVMSGWGHGLNGRRRA